MIRFFAEHRTAALLLGIIFSAAGLMSLPALQRETFPDYLADRVEVTVAYPGASAEEVEETVCLAVEDALDGVSGVDELTCTARANVGIVNVKAIYGYDVGRMLIDLKTEIDAIDTFPASVKRPIVRQLNVTEPVVSLALSGPMSAPDLKALAETIKARVTRIPGVAEVTIGGFSEPRFEIALNDARLRAYGLSAAAVADVIRRQSLDLPAGTVETGEHNLRIRFVDRSRTVAELERVVLRDVVGGIIRLGDVATISRGFVDPEVKTLFNGERAAIINIRRDKSDDALRVYSAVETFVVEERARMPRSVSLTPTNDATSLIADRLGLLLMNAIQGLVLIFAVLWTFFTGRFSITVAAALPLSLLASVFVLQAMGYNLNLLSTVGLLIAVALLIDSAVVINENIVRNARAGLSVVEAAITGVNQVSGAVLASFLTSVAIFAPLAYLEGDIGRVLRVVPVVLIIVLSASLIISFLILPHFTARALAHERRGRLRMRIDNGFDWFRDTVIGRLADYAVAGRYLTLGLCGLSFLVALSILAGGTLKFQAFPDIEGDIVEARLMMTAGTPLERTESTADALVSALSRVDDRLSSRNPGGRRLVENITVSFAANPDFADHGTHLATIKADILGSELRKVRISEILDAWREETGRLTDVVSLTFKEPILSPAGQALELRLSGDDIGALRRAGAELVELLGQYDGIMGLTTNIHDGPQEIRLSLREGAGTLGIDAATIALQLRAALEGVTADELQVGRESIRTDVRNNAAWRADLGNLDDFMVTLANGRRIPLSAVAKVDHGHGLALIPRIDRRRTLTVSGDVDTRRINANEVLATVGAGFRPMLAERHPGVSMRFEGQAARQAETAGSMRRVFGIGLIAMFIILSFQFRSYIEPIIVMVAIPLGLTGVVAGHLLMGLDLSMPSMVGFVSLAGIVVNNSILLVAFIRHHLDAGRSVVEAARHATLDRFRAIFVTTATTIAGLVPLLFETSVQAQVLIPLVTSLVFGLIASTILVLFLVPALYVVLDDLKSIRMGSCENQDVRL